MITVKANKNPLVEAIDTPELKRDKTNNAIGYITVEEYFSKLREAVERKYQERSISLRWCEALPRAVYPCRLCLH
jgi:hypothetical protein